ncbi:MAG: hypothetical protein KUG78_20680 [Kangiellaceae bacterium]|nr:hypothetical protein [Kangiellaceae bacterium]
MRWKIALVVALILGAVGGSWLKNLPGFVIIAYNKTSYEMRLWIAISLLMLFMVIVYVVIMFIRSILASPNRIKNWKGERHWRKARKQTIKGMLSFIEGRWKQSETTMINAAKNSDTKLINYLVAAQSAQHQNSQDRRDAYLRLAHAAEPNAKVAIGLTQAQLQLDNLQFEQALATLSDLSVKNSNHPFILKLLCVTHRKLEDWQAIIEILPALKKQKVFVPEKLDRIESQSVVGILKSAVDKGELESFNDAWINLPSASRKKSNHILSYATSLIVFNQMDEAEKLVKLLFKKNPSEQVICLFGEIKSTNGNKQFTFLENWYNNHSDVPACIYLALAKVAFSISLWGKARFYLERGIRTAPCAESYFMMAKTLQQLDDHELAAECYRQGLEHVVHPEVKGTALLLEDGSEDLVSANLLPKLESTPK